MHSVPRSVREKLGYYVYIYVDPRDGRTFYVGKGKGNRIYAHLNEDDAGEAKKVRCIRELRKLGKRPTIEILKYGLTEDEAFLVEATAIDLLGLDQLTNRVKGHHAMRGRVEEIVQELDAKVVKITHPVILINVSQLYRHGMTGYELYDITRSAWKVGPRCARAKYAFCVYRGIVRAVYCIAKWLPANSTMTFRNYAEKDYDFSERCEFVGRLAPEKMQRKYVGKSVTQYFAKGSQNPIKYVNC